MNVPRAIWSSESVRTAIESGDLGAIIRAIRKANNLTLAELADRCGYSASTVSRLERGKQPLRDVAVLRSFADALGVPAHVLGLSDTPWRSVPARRPPTSLGATLAPQEGTDPMRRRSLLTGLTGMAGSMLLGPVSGQAAATADPVAALENAVLNSPTAGVPMPLPHLRRTVAAARSMYQHGRYTKVCAALPELMQTAIATHAEATTGDDIAAVNGQIAEVYTLATDLVIKLGHDHLAWATADRALQTAYVSEDILSQAAARRAWGILLRRNGRAQTAQRLVLDTAAALQPELRHGPEYTAVYGSLLSTAAYTAAVDGDRDTARTLQDEAVDAAHRLGVDTNHRATAFGPTGVGLYQVSIAHALGDSGTAIEAARRINPAAIPFAERRARYWVDVARAFHQWGKPESCYRALLAAEHACPDEVRYRKPIHEITINLRRHPNARALPGLNDFARRTGTPT